MSASTGVAGEDASSAVALVNTRHLQSGQPADLLADPARAAGWLAERGLLPRGTAAVRIPTRHGSLRCARRFAGCSLPGPGSASLPSMT